MNINECCFCGQMYEDKGYGNDIRPLRTKRGNTCCDKCNQDIVIPNRQKFWFEGYHGFAIKDKDSGKFINRYGLPSEIISSFDDKRIIIFDDAQYATHHMMIDQLRNHKVVMVQLREDE